MTRTKSKTVAIDRGDLLAAWAVLENLAVSLDQIGGAFAADHNAGNGVAGQRAFHAALAGYLQPQLLRDIRAARARLAEYVSDHEAEKLTANIPYWDYRTARARARRKT